MAEKKVNTTNEEEKKKKKKIFIIFGSILGAGAIVGAGVGIYYAVKPNNQVDAVLKEEVVGVKLETNIATIGKDFDTKILVDTSKTSGKVLKDTLDEVKSDNETLTKDTNYTYSVDNAKTTGTLHIPAEYVKGKIEIKVTLVTPQPDPPVTKSWKAMLDKTSQQYGSFQGGKSSITIKEYIGYESATISFIPNDSTVSYIVTAKDKELNDLEASYVAGTTASIILTKTEGVFTDGDEIKIHLEEPAPIKTATLSLDENSKQYGKLKYKTQEAAYTIDISEEITHSSFTVDFVPESGFEGVIFTINFTDDNFSATQSEDKITITADDPLKDKDTLVMSLIPPTYTASVIDRPLTTFSTIKLDGSSFTVGSLVTGTITPNEHCSLPENARAIFFCSDNTFDNPIIGITVDYDKEDGGAFSFIMPNQDIYVGAFCYSSYYSTKITIVSNHESHPTSTSGWYTQLVTITFGSPDSEYHIAVDKDEFLSTHYLLGDYVDSNFSYTYNESSGEGTLSFQVRSGLIIAGSAPAD